MKHLRNRVELMTRLGQYFNEMPEALQDVIELANRQNAWFTPDFVKLAIENIANAFLDDEKLWSWTKLYSIPDPQDYPKTVGLVMAGNIPLVGFHDFLCVFIFGHHLKVKLSSKDTVLWEHIFSVLRAWNADFDKNVSVSEMLKHCDAYIATGSNNSSRYFEYYFQKYPHIIRKNRTSVAVLNGNESKEMLNYLSEDVNLFYGLGCRNVSQIYVPKDYNFEPLLQSFNKFVHHRDHNKFTNNYDYQLALYLLNKQFYMSNGHMLLVENELPFAPISVVHFCYYKEEDKQILIDKLIHDDHIQCITYNGFSKENSPKIQSFGDNQKPSLTDYADGVDTMLFLEKL